MFSPKYADVFYTFTLYIFFYRHQITFIMRLHKIACRNINKHRSFLQ